MATHKASRTSANPILTVVIGKGGVALEAPGWQGLRFGPCVGQLAMSGKVWRGELAEYARAGQGWQLAWRFGTSGLVLRQSIRPETPCRVRVLSTLTNGGKDTVRFERAELVTISGVRNGRFDLGRQLAQVRVLEQSTHSGQVRSVGQILTGIDQRRSMGQAPGSFNSSLVTVFHSPAETRSLLVGFESFDRWIGSIRGGSVAAREKLQDAFENVDKSSASGASVVLANATLKPSQRLTEFAIELSGANVPVDPGQSLALEEFVIEVGTDPFAMLEQYADRVAARYQVRDVPAPFATWCSWYPYRLGVSEQRMIDTAKAAKARHLDRLGLRFIQADLGWEKQNLPTFFEENERFPHGLAWLSRRLRETGFRLGVWQALGSVADTHPVFKQHPDWLVRDDKGKPVQSGKWFWQPHAGMHSLDVTHPKAVEWLRRNVESLAQRGVRYLKWDFGSTVACHGHRHDERVACSGAAEGIRRTARLVRDAMNSAGEKSTVLNCTGMEVAGVGNFGLLYTNADTGNTAIGFAHLHSVYQAAATHAFKNQRWALLQPSCLVVGLPGTLEEARVRATVTFLMAGDVDIGDNLTNLPEDRWQVLLSVLPQLQTPARPVSLFRPVRISTMSYEALCKGEKATGPCTEEPQGATVWHCHIAGGWDEWDLVGVFNLLPTANEKTSSYVPLRFEIPFEVLGLDPAQTCWAHEFWSNQFLGSTPVARWPDGTYRHPGDNEALLNDSEPGVLDLTFAGPAVKLLVLRQPRRHPWPVGTTFHQSGGLELADVRWDAKSRTLRGNLLRPPGQYGLLTVAGIPRGAKVTATVNGHAVTPTSVANGAVGIPIATDREVNAWEVKVR